MIIKNTPENLAVAEAISSHFLQRSHSYYPGRQSGEQSHNVGLLPMALELPASGEEVVFDGLGAPGAVEFSYRSQRDRAQYLWHWYLAGGIAVLVLGRRQPWWRTAGQCSL